MSDLNIVELIEKNPLTYLSCTSGCKLAEKIKIKFDSYDAKLFISSFYCYLNYNKQINFIVDLDFLWLWLGFSTKQHAVRVLERHFIENKDFISNLLTRSGNQDKASHGGHNVKKYFLNIRCFKLLCLKAQTEKADQIHNYYINLEEIVNETVAEEAEEMKRLLMEKENMILEIQSSKEKEIKETIEEKRTAVEKAILSQFSVNTECIYLGTIDDTNIENEKLLKFGHSNDLNSRVVYHHGNSYTNFKLCNAFKVTNRTEIENLIKNHPVIRKHIRRVEINGKMKTELIAYDETSFTIDKLCYYIKEIIKTKTYSIENFNKLLQENENLQKNNEELRKLLDEIKNDLNYHILQNQTLTAELEEKKEVINKIRDESSAIKEEAPCKYNDIFSRYIAECCLLHPDFEESSVNLEGQFRIWRRIKPSKELFHELKSYLDTKFKPGRLQNQIKDQVVNGYFGLKLKPIEYKKESASSSQVENFVFQECYFSPCGKILNSTLLEHYRKWKQTVGLSEENNDMRQLKDYLDQSKYALKAVVWTSEGSNDGYYGLDLKTNISFHRKTSSTGKTVEKRDVKTNVVLAKWETIAKAASAEFMSASKMSRSIKNNIIFNNEYIYCVS